MALESPLWSFCRKSLFKIFIGAQFIYSVLLASGIQQSESIINISNLLLLLFSHISHHRVLSRISYAIQQVLISYLFINIYCLLVQSLQSCPTLWDPMDCSPPGSSVHGIFRQEYWSGFPVLSPRIVYMSILISQVIATLHPLFPHNHKLNLHICDSTPVS